MRDYKIGYVNDRGTHLVAVADLPLNVVHLAIAHINDGTAIANTTATLEQVKDRLEIELIARKLEGRI